MLIPLSEIQYKYSLDIKGIIHIGAYNAEELPSYRACGVPKVIWIEALLNLATRLKNRFEHDDTQRVINAVVSDDSRVVDFNVTNNEASSSILQLGTHLQHHPKIYTAKTERRLTLTMEQVIHKYDIDMGEYNFLNIDIQGAELKALKGMGSHLKHIDYLYLEVNREYIYKECCLIGELDEFLTDFTRVETKWTAHEWGDAIYIRKSVLLKGHQIPKLIV